jgi:S-formylglutathione hydrolase FrmB
VRAVVRACLVMSVLAGCGSCALSRTVRVRSRSMQRAVRTIVVLPGSYAASVKRYPVAYLLHGYGGAPPDWPERAPLQRLADSLELIFVCPDGGGGSWYIDSPVRAGSAYETFTAKELPEAIDRRFRTIARPEGRCLIGSSMGGHGALYLAARHPGQFCGAGSIAGIMDLTEFPRGYDIERVLGPLEKNRKRWQEHSALSVAALPGLRNTALYLSCGTGDRAALSGNRRMHELLDSLGIDHVYEEKPGGHSPDFVRSVIGAQIGYFAKVLAPAAAE